ncbi:unnamed protein product [Peniophora sp. CBMAI 1063]|nr:unnamed protein product [Peniophora sp. CBMAI 1063]
MRVLGQPHEFYSTLLNMIRNAQERIFISSLYIGSSEHELVGALESALDHNRSLHVYLQLDYNRSTRPGPSSTTTLLAPLLERYPDRVHVSLFRSPKLKGLMAKLVPPRFNEGWGTWHAKIYGADNNVMISGANLNKSYFTDRQDRYLHFSSEPTLANYCFGFLKTVSTFSFKVLASGPHSATPPTPVWTDSSVHPHNIEAKAATALKTFQAAHTNSRRLSSSISEDETLIMPVIQGGQFGIREEERGMSMLFKHISKAVAASTGEKPLINFTSGYFGLYDPYQELILTSGIDTRILCASPLANGFYGSSGISGRIPEGYTYLEQRFMKAVKSAGKEWRSEIGSGVHLAEWHKPDWTYHAKGIWVSPSHSSAPYLTLFGSTNLNSRSAHLDTELSFFMLTSSESVRRQLQAEQTAISAHAEPWKGAERRVRLGTKALVKVVGGML